MNNWFVLSTAFLQLGATVQYLHGKDYWGAALIFVYALSNFIIFGMRRLG